MNVSKRVIWPVAGVVVLLMSIVFGPSPLPLVCLAGHRPVVGSCVPVEKAFASILR